MRRRRQRGVALVSVLFVVVILTLLVSQLLTSGWRSATRTAWLQSQAQAYEYAVGGEQMARQLLHEELQALKSESRQHSPIPGPVRRFRPARGDILLKLEDIQGKVNLNNLLHDDFAALPRRYLTEIQPQPALIPALADWMDGDTLARPGGGEDDDYFSAEQPFRAANGPLAHLSEIAAIAGDLAAAVEPLATGATVLNRPTPLNINTLQPELAPLVHPRLSASQLANAQESEPFNSIQDFLQSDLTAGLAINPTLFTVSSNYYRASILARFGEWRQPLISRFSLDPVSGGIELLDRELTTQGMGGLFENSLQSEERDEADLAL